MTGSKFRSAATRKKISKAMSGKNNSQYKDGRRSYRNIAGAKDNDGSLIHHKNGNRHDNRPSNLVKIPKSKRGEHDKIHHRENNLKRKKK